MWPFRKVINWSCFVAFHGWIFLLEFNATRNKDGKYADLGVALLLHMISEKISWQA